MDTSRPAVVLGFHHGSLGVARSLGRLGVAVHGVDVDPGMAAMSSRYLRERLRWDVHGAPAPATVEWLLALGERLGEAVLIATTDPAALIVAEHADALSRRFRFPGNPPELIRAFSDKRSLFFLARRHGIPTAGAAFPESAADVHRYLETATFPVMLKGIDGMRLEARTGKQM